MTLGRDLSVCSDPQQERVGDEHLDGEGGPACWSRETVPAFVLSADREPFAVTCLSAVCRTHYASPTPARVEHSRPCEVKAAQVVGMMGVGALALALTRMVGLANQHGRQHHLFEVGDCLCYNRGITL